MKEILLEILPTFISKQALVHQAMTELRPHLIMAATDSEKLDYEKFVELAEEYSHIPQVGQWTSEEDEWDYFVHGMGCRLTNVKTLEPIEWDAPNVDSFHDRWFFNWAMWHFKHKQNRSDLTYEALVALLKELVNDGLIEQVKTTSGIEFRIRQ